MPNDREDYTGVTTTLSSMVFRGEPTDWDFNAGTFPLDGSEHYLDVSSIIPAGSVAAYVKLSFLSTATFNVIFYVKGLTHNFHEIYVYPPKVSPYQVEKTLILFLDANAIITYSSSAYTMLVSQLTVLGWFP